MRHRLIFPIKGWVRELVCIAVFFFICSFLLGCAPQTSYKVLSFFFDGVPNPDEKSAQSKGGGGGGAASQTPRPKYREHGPYAAKLCAGCHERGTNVLILPVEKLCLNCHIIQTEKKYIHGPVAAGGCIICHDPHGSSFPFLLNSEPQKFCLHCHDIKDVARNVVHAGITGGCTECHDAHKSDDRYLLK